MNTRAFLIAGSDSHNLDGWMMSLEYNREVFLLYNQDTDVAVVEGVMGLFDGFSGGDEAVIKSLTFEQNDILIKKHSTR